jgi:hypothetical protein
LKLEVAASVEMRIDARDYLGGISETADERAAVDKIELARIDPFVFRVVDLEAAVWGDAWLYEQR